MKNLLIGFLLSVSTMALAQTGGGASYAFLNQTANARVAALGGVNVSHLATDVNLIRSNPALMQADFHQWAAFNTVGFPADIRHHQVVYAHQVDKFGMLGASVHYVAYGNLTAYDDAGNALGDFDAAEYGISLAHSRSSGNFTAGMAIQWAGSRMADFNSSALMADLGLVFRHPEKELSVGMAIKNLGFIVRDFTETSESRLPTDLQLGLTFKPQFMPFRFTFTSYRWLTSSALYNQDRISREKPSLVDEAFSRIGIGTELLLNKSFQLRLGYNHQVREELRLPEVSGGAGFSFGFMLKIKAFEFAYTRAAYHPAGGANFISIATDMKKIIKKSRIVD